MKHARAGFFHKLDGVRNLKCLSQDVRTEIYDHMTISNDHLVDDHVTMTLLKAALRRAPTSIPTQVPPPRDTDPKPLRLNIPEDSPTYRTSLQKR